MKMVAPRAVKGMYHFAFPCRDAEETRAFYEDLVGLPLTSCVEVDSVPSSGDPGPYLHLFFEMGDGSYVAFFDLGKGEMPQPSPNTPKWVQHLALEVPTIDDVQVVKRRLEAAQVTVNGLVDHEFVKSIYFFDPNGLRLEITCRTEPPGFLEEQAAQAHAVLARWTASKAKSRSGAA
jgi:catechol 2,3-dioxygenase-like lactoylglutathione lyase family enzyme